MRLVACAHCHTQFDVTDFSRAALRCHCGMLILLGVQTGRIVPVARCGQCGAPWSEGASSCTYCGGVLDRAAELPLICPECYAQNPEGSRHCRGCGVAFNPEPLEREETDALCPRCTGNGNPARLSRRSLRGFWISECGGCHGLWVARADFEALVNRTAQSDRLLPEQGAPEPVDVRKVVQYLRCPQCDTMMQRRNFEVISGVIIDQCKAHGMWLDADELEQIARFVASGGLGRAQELKIHEAEQLLAADEERVQSRIAQAGVHGGVNWLVGVLGRSRF